MNWRAWALAAAWAVSATNVWAFEDEASFSNYDVIVSELKATADEPVEPYAVDSFDWSRVSVHGGLALTTSWVNVEMPDLGITSSGLLKGFEAHAGFNVLGRDARAEGYFRNFAHDGLSNLLQADMRELGARIVFLPALRERTTLRMGAGLSERFMKVLAKLPEAEQRRSWATPYYSLLLGFEHRIARQVAIGPDISHHAPLDASSYSKSSWDASFRLNATF